MANHGTVICEINEKMEREIADLRTSLIIVNVATADPAASKRGMNPPPHKAESSKRINH